MLYVFHGTDAPTSGDKAHTLVNSLRTKKPDAAFVHVTADERNSSVIEEHLGGQGLFSNKYIVFLDRITENNEAKEKVVDFISSMKESSNIFIVLEGKLLADLKKSFEKHAEKVVISDEKDMATAFKKKEFNIFSLADAVGSRDAIKSWMIYRQAIENGIESESILGTLFWQAKSMVLAREAQKASEAGLNPFVFAKAKKYAGNYSKGELNTLVTRLITLYHDGHRGMNDLELSIESLLLNCGN